MDLSLLLKCEKIWETSKVLPQYTYIVRPVYKFVASHTNSMVAIPVTFFITDLIAHQLLANALEYAFNPAYEQFYWNRLQSLVWTALALPVMYAKYSK